MVEINWLSGEIRHSNGTNKWARASNNTENAGDGAMIAMKMKMKRKISKLFINLLRSRKKVNDESV